MEAFSYFLGMLVAGFPLYGWLWALRGVSRWHVRRGWRWGALCVAQGGVLGLIGLAGFLNHGHWGAHPMVWQMLLLVEGLGALAWHDYRKTGRWRGLPWTTIPMMWMYYLVCC